MRPEDLVGSVIGGLVGARGKSSRGALRYLTGGRGSLLDAGTLLTVAGLAWGAYEAATSNDGRVQPPPLPSMLPPPPLPTDAVRLLRLAVAAARADGRLADPERAAVLAQARAAGVEGLVQTEMDRPRVLAEIVDGVNDPAARRDLYALAFAVVRADESVTGGERIFLAQLAHALGLDPAAAAQIESEAASRIDAAREG